MCSVSVNSPAGVIPEEEKQCYGGKDMWKREGFKKVLNMEGKTEGVMDDNSGESTVEEVLAAIFYGFR